MAFENLPSKKITLICAIYLFSTAMSTFTRYTKPIPQGVIVCDTYEQLSAVAKDHPDTGLWEGDGGYYIRDGGEKGKILAVASDALIPELDSRTADLGAHLAKHPEERAPEDPEELKAWIAADPGHCTKVDAPSADCDRNTKANNNDKSQVRHDAHPNRCSHPRCFNSAICLTYTDCHVCLRNRHCI